jgi:tetratricopeptide (TPR) repeat protein
VFISDAEAEAMRKVVLSAEDIDTVMMRLEDGMISKYSKAARHNEMLDIINELHKRPFMEPGVINLYLKQGSICEAMFDYAMAIDYYSRGIQAYATKIKIDNRHSYWIFNNSSFCHNYERRFLEAQRLADKAISIDREKYNAWKNLGVSYEHQGKHVEASAYYMAAHIKCGGGSDPRPMLHLKRIFRRHDGLRDDLARQARKIIGKIFPGSFRTFALAETYYQCGDLDRAASKYGKFFSIAPYGYADHLKYAHRIMKELKELKQIEAQLA